MDYTNFIYACVAASLIVVFFTIGVPGTNAVITSIVCYYTLAAAILMLAIQSAANIKGSLGPFIIKMLPFLSIFGILLFSGILMNLYFDQISGNKVSDYYYNFSKISVILVMIQIGVFLRVLFQNTGSGLDSLSRQTLATLGLLATLNFIVLTTLSISLKYYTTDC